MRGYGTCEPGMVLDDGEYDGIVVDAELEAGHDEGGAAAVVRLEVAILGGVHKGEVVAVRAHGLVGDPLDALGLPVTLTVADGAPRVRFDQ